MKPFANEPTLELRRAPARESLLNALRGLEPRLPLAVPVLIGRDTGAHEGFESTDPGEPDRVVTTAGRATTALAMATAEGRPCRFSRRSGREEADRCSRTETDRAPGRWSGSCSLSSRDMHGMILDDV